MQINLPKSDLVPSQRKQYLGMVLDSMSALVFPSPERVNQFLLVAQSFQEYRSPTVSLWRSLLGHLTSLERLVPGGQVCSQSLQWCLKKHWKAASTLVAGSSFTAVSGRPLLVDGSRSSSQGSFLCDGSHKAVSVFQRLPSWLGCSSGLLSHLGGVVFPEAEVSHPQPGNDGCFPDFAILSAGTVGHVGVSHVRQLNNDGLFMEFGGHSLVSLHPRFMPGCHNAVADVLSREWVGLE
ncbi:hypothetical protein E2C01_071703 [Portunus trituberculatus]|uniref:Uncharacterized protein n=1 Tax=Portunus trituberculatus TaxID=210409 RepID=A0A5B7I0K1_PORTR|nr:hypothetical protein [Portunus trituberculatus]